MSATLLKALAERAVDAAAHGTRSLVDLPVDVLALVLVQLVDPFLDRKFDLHLRGSDALFHSIGRPEPADRFACSVALRMKWLVCASGTCKQLNSASFNDLVWRPSLEALCEAIPLKSAEDADDIETLAAEAISWRRGASKWFDPRSLLAFVVG
jgi:hypothetical protein